MNPGFSMNTSRHTTYYRATHIFFFFFSFSLLLSSASLNIAEATTVTVSAEGLADPGNDSFQADRNLLYDALLNDAKKQAIEKVVGMYVKSQSLRENYSTIEDTVLSQTQGFIKQIIQKSEPWLGKDGFMHILIKAEVYTTKAQMALEEMNRSERIKLIKHAGNPRISVAILIKDHDRDSTVEPHRSTIAENILKEKISEFGYRVFSEKEGLEKKNAPDYTMRNTTDFSIRGEVKFKEQKLKLQTSGLEMTKLAITSWTVNCISRNTGEEIYFNNTIPSKKSYNTEDEAIRAVGQLIGSEFSQDFFEQHLMQRTATYELEVHSLPVYDAAVLFKKELIGLRPVLNADLKSYDATQGALYEVEFSKGELDFSEYLNIHVLKPLNYKFGRKAFSLVSVKNQLIQVAFQEAGNSTQLVAQFEEKPPSSLAMATPVRLHKIASTKGALEKVEAVNPSAVNVVKEYRRSGGKTSLQAIRDF